jgi:hypothetical protein
VLRCQGRDTHAPHQRGNVTPAGGHALALPLPLPLPAQHARTWEQRAHTAQHMAQHMALRVLADRVAPVQAQAVAGNGPLPLQRGSIYRLRD